MTSNPRWISGNAWRDVLLLCLPGLLALVWVPLLPLDGIGALLGALVVSSFLDSGHVYTTFYRLWIYGKGTGRRSFLGLPLVVCSVFFLWTYWQLPYLWSFVVYATIFHNVRQFYGFLRWYEHLNGHRSRVTHAYFYLLLVLPVVLYHFRSGVPRGMYSPVDLVALPPNSWLHYAVFILYVFAWMTWGFHEMKLARERGIEWNRLSAMLTPAIIYGWCMARGTNVQEVLYPLLVAHGVSYIFASVISIRRSEPTKNWSLRIAIGLVIATAIVFGLIEGVFEEGFLGDLIFYWQGPSSVVNSLVLGVYLTPLMSHYTYDMWLWTSKHPDFKRIVGRSAAATSY